MIDNIYGILQSKPKLNNENEIKIWEANVEILSNLQKDFIDELKRYDKFLKLFTISEGHVKSFRDNMANSSNSKEGVSRDFELFVEPLKQISGDLEEFADKLSLSVEIRQEFCTNLFRHFSGQMGMNHLKALKDEIDETEKKIEEQFEKRREVNKSSKVGALSIELVKLNGEHEKFDFMCQHFEQSNDSLQEDIDKDKETISRLEETKSQNSDNSSKELARLNEDLENRRKELEKEKKKEMTDLYNSKEENNRRNQDNMQNYTRELDNAVTTKTE